MENLYDVIIIGSGPAGLSCAWFLAQMGYPVTVFEAMPLPGGMLRYGIPAYRLPDAIVAAHIARLEAMGIAFRCNTKIGEGADLSLSDLKRLGFKAVMLAPGTTVSRKVRMEGVELPGVHWGLEFLRANRGDEQPRLSGDVLVIGGGDVAVDAAITAKRLGAAKVSMACLESRETMPAYPHNQADALREGIECHCGFGPGTILQENGHVAGMELKTCIRVVDEQGRFAPLFDENATMRIRADHIIFAIGQASELDGFAKDVRTEQGRIVIEDVTFSTSAWGIFAAGDAATGPKTLILAMAQGEAAAKSIDQYLKTREPAFFPRTRLSQIIAKAKLVGACRPTRPLPIEARYTSKFLDPEARSANWEEVEGAMTIEEARQESQRCMRCMRLIAVTTRNPVVEHEPTAPNAATF